MARVRAIQHELEQIDGPVILVAHSAGVLMVAHWAAQLQPSDQGRPAGRATGPRCRLAVKLSIP